MVISARDREKGLVHKKRQEVKEKGSPKIFWKGNWK